MNPRIQLLCCALALATLFSCGDKAKKKKAAETKSVEAFTVSVHDTIVSNHFVADIQARNNVEIHARIAGLLEKVFVNEGQKVRKGQTLFKISDAELQIQLLKADAVYKNMRADLRIANVGLEQAQTLFDKKVIADKEVELAKARKDAASSKLSHADAERQAIRQQISFTRITAPFDGVLDRIPYKEGSLVENGALLSTVSQLDEVYAYFSIPEDIYFGMVKENRLARERNIRLVLPNGSVYSQKGQLKTADGEIDRQTGSIQFKAEFKNPDGFIKHGTSGKLIISEPRQNVLLIPQKSVFSIQDKQFVFVIETDGSVRMTNILTAGSLDDVYIVEKGLKAGQRIVQEGIQSIKDGDHVKIREVKTP